MTPKNLQIGKTALITTHNWFTAPDGRQYKAVFGTVNSVMDATETLGLKTNAHSTNWYVECGNMTIAGCQINYAIRTDSCNFGPAETHTVHEGVLNIFEQPSYIYNADQGYAG